MRDLGVGSWAVRRARMSPDAVALVDGDARVTFAQVEGRSGELAQALRAAGIGRGERVAFLGVNSVDFVVTLFAVARLGAVFVPLNTRLAPAELSHILTDCSPRLLLHDRGISDLAAHRDIAALRIPTGEAQDVLTGGPGAPATALDEHVALDDLFMIQYTSGTSGRPKGVMLTHGNITWNVFNVLIDLDLSQHERALVTAPLFHTAALNQLLLPTFMKGGTSYLEAHWDPHRALSLIEKERITFLFGVTSMYLALAQHPRWPQVDLTSLTTALSGGSPLPLSLLDTFATRGVPIVQGYGLTESSPGATMLRRVDAQRKIGSAGTACFFTDTRVVDLDFAEVPAGVAGEILVAGPNVSPGYWQNPTATEASRIDSDWLRTGDLGRVDSDGFLTIVDRLKDMFISGGENIYPAEVEQAIHAHPEVSEAAVFGVPDAKWGEVGRAVVVPIEGSSLTPEQVLLHLDGRIARYKIPKSVVIVHSMPHTASGKLVKSRVRDLYGPVSGEGENQ